MHRHTRPTRKLAWSHHAITFPWALHGPSPALEYLMAGNNVLTQSLLIVLVVSEGGAKVQQMCLGPLNAFCEHGSETPQLYLFPGPTRRNSKHRLLEVT